MSSALMASPPPLSQKRFQIAKSEAVASLEEAQKVQGRRMPILAGSGRGCQCWVPAPQHPRAGSLTLGCGVHEGGIGPLPLLQMLPFPLLSQADRFWEKAEGGTAVQVPGASPPISCQVLGCQQAQAEPGMGRGGTQDRWPGAGVRVADGR